MTEIFSSDITGNSDPEDSQVATQAPSKKTRVSEPICPYEILIEGIPKFDGEYPLITKQWLAMVEELFPVTGPYGDVRTLTARARLTGNAAQRMARVLTNDYETFSKRLLSSFSPEVAYSVLFTEISAQTRYMGLPSIEHAVDLAVDDFEAVSYHMDCTNPATSVDILQALIVLFPSIVSTGGLVDILGPFNQQIAILRRILHEGHSQMAAWVNPAQMTQAHVDDGLAENSGHSNNRRCHGCHRTRSRRSK
ncbi:hypothetical protein COEREDRAFT_99420 [Coemansia reversa NRRL 1564]|uniref:Uncharacterized protein n=1 Tax=Coemansia reversa (strain ATCC 12441 / NRRL 1564) TaxID=763665 RepID=A0A2G5B3Z5_COERN|nr:hypothetical protein COEREDRAFT_99420 [Coemansia reversa NRRL 1564]|eukprot:PIA13722.1 hypothetical protein COEREDRAFT_99420 [Coemansia reversa NRRL 1564]